MKTQLKEMTSIVVQFSLYACVLGKARVCEMMYCACYSKHNCWINDIVNHITCLIFVVVRDVLRCNLLISKRSIFADPTRPVIILIFLASCTFNNRYYSKLYCACWYSKRKEDRHSVIKFSNREYIVTRMMEHFCIKWWKFAHDTLAVTVPESNLC